MTIGWLLLSSLKMFLSQENREELSLYSLRLNSFIAACIKLKKSDLLSGSTIHSPSHSQPFGGRKYSLFSLIFPVTSENLWRPTSPEVPHLPNRRAWFSYCLRKKKKNKYFRNNKKLLGAKNIYIYVNVTTERFYYMLNFSEIKYSLTTLLCIIIINSSLSFYSMLPGKQWFHC